jgi:hypothetical protein
MNPRFKKPYQTQTMSLLPLPVDVDLVRFETNLLQIGFFSAQDPRRQKRDSHRRLEQTVTRDGQRIRVTAEFRSSELLGLPSTADRDKFLALMKIVSEQRATLGTIQNPIRFTGYRLLRELGHSDAGQNYEEISNWGRRMADTTITSERVVYFSARKRYSDKTIHVFRSFQRIGESNLDNTGRTEAYEVELEDWLLENLNHGYVVPEDFSAYKKLTRPTAKGIFGNLHLWFHASQGGQVEKDYTELCNFLNVKAYPHASRIRETMGPSLDDLIKVGYLSSWRLEPMTTKAGFKLVLLPGQELLRVMTLSRRKQLPEKNGHAPELSSPQQTAIDALLVQGILPAKAKALVMQHDPQLIVDQIEYAIAQVIADSKGRQKIGNPAGFIIYNIEQRVPVPSSFITSRKSRELNIRKQERDEKEGLELRKQVRYEEWTENLVNAEINARYQGEDIKKKLREIISRRQKNDSEFKTLCARLTKEQLDNVALGLLRKDMKKDLSLPSYDEWCERTMQGELF